MISSYPYSPSVPPTIVTQIVEQRVIPLSAKLLAWSTILGMTFFQRLSVTSLDIPVIELVLYICIAWLLYEQRIKVDLNKSLLFFLSCAILVLSTLLGDMAAGSTGLISLSWIIILYLPFIFVWDANTAEVYKYFVDTYRKVIVVMAVIGIAQYTLQFVGISLSDLVWSRVSEKFIRGVYNYDIWVEWGSNLRKANGVFFLEPSFFSKALALAILLELLYRGNVVRLILFHVALVLSFSGTGIILAAVGYALLLFRRFDFRILLIIGMTVLVIAFVLLTGYSDIFVGRLDEFANPNASAYKRFIAPYKSIMELELYNNFLSGFGPGSGQEAAKDVGTHLGYFFKFFYEYGVLPMIMFLVFVVSCVLGNGVPAALIIALFVSYTVLGGGLLEPMIITKILLLCSWFRLKPQQT